MRGGKITKIKNDGKHGVPGPNYVEITLRTGIKSNTSMSTGTRIYMSGKK
jgi:hypothetical protein